MEYMYGALLLHKLGKEVSEDNLKSVVASAVGDDGIDDAKIKSLVASLKNVDIDKELESASLVSAAPAAGASPGEGAQEEAKEEKPKEEKKEAAAEGLSALFG
ncbi:MAG: 50S ribosomal protein L12 [Candidatus Pacearchaeota archaeon]